MTLDQKLKARSISSSLENNIKQELLQKAKNRCMECSRRAADRNIFFSLMYSYKGDVASNIRILCGLCYRDYHFDAQLNFYVFEEDCILEGVHDTVCVQ